MQKKRIAVIPIALLVSILAYICLALFQQAPVAQAHAFVIGSDPVDGSTVSSVPDEVHIYFNATISPLSSAIVYSIQDGTTVNINGANSYISTADARELVIPIKTPNQQPQGSYEVKWTAIANDDGHTTFGLIGFNVGYSGTGLTGSTTLGPSTSNNLDAVRALNFTNILAIVWEWLGLIALTFWISQLVIEHLLLTKERLSGLYIQVKKRTGSLQGFCLFVFLFAECISLILRVTNISSASDTHTFSVSDLLALLFQSNYGHWWLIRVILVIVAIVLYYGAWKMPVVDVNKENVEAKSQLIPATKAAKTTTAIQQKLQSSSYTPKKTIQLLETPIKKPIVADTHTPGWFILAGLILIATVQTSVLAGIAQPHFSVLIMDLLSIVSQALWLGGFAYLCFVLLPILLGTELEYNTDTLILLLKRFTPFLFISMGVQLLCFFFLSEVSINAPQNLLNDPYGRILDLQGIGLLVEVLLTILTLRLLRPKLTHQALGLPVVHADLPTRRERQSKLRSTGKNIQFLAGSISVIGAAILLCTALLSFFAPPINFPDKTYAATPLSEIKEADNMQSKEIGDLTATLQVLPGKSGTQNSIILTMLDNKQQPVSDAEVKITINMQTMDMGTVQSSIAAGNPTYIARFNKQETFSMAGLWNIEVSISRPGQTTVTGTFNITITA